MMLAVLAIVGEARAQSPSRMPQEDVLRPLISPTSSESPSQADTSSDEPRRSRVAIRGKSQTEKLVWQLDDPSPKPGPKMRPVSAATASKPRMSGRSATPARTAGHQYPVRQAGGEEPLRLQPATETVAEPTPIEMSPEEMVGEIEPSPPTEVLPSRPRSISTIYQPKKDEGAKSDAAPDIKCPTMAELMRPIGELTVDIAPSKGDVPKECPLFDQAFEPRMWCDSLYTWKASSLCHKPLYFEHMSLERYGHTWHPFLQPVVSGAHFFGTLPILPYKMGIEDPCECVYALGYYRPGSCAPKMLYPLPISIRGAVYEAAAVTGLVLLLP
jgi:hypothetical protein